MLHTWGQNLLHHPHIHFLVPGGGIALDGESWIACRPGFLLPVTVLSRMFRGLFLHYLEKAFTAGELQFFAAYRHLHEPAAFRRHLAPIWNTEWVVYAKRPFAGPAQVLDYVGRYTHRVAISNNRLLSMDNGKVRFRWKDYRDGYRQKTMTLDGGSSSAASSFMCCRTGFTASGTMASSATVTAPGNSHAAASYSGWRQPHPRPIRPLIIVIASRR